MKIYHNRFSPNRKHNKGDKKYKTLPKRCQKCGSTSNLDIDHKDGNRKNGNRSNLRVLCRSCHRKMHDGKGSASQIDLFAKAKIIELDTEQLVAVQKAVGAKVDEDLMLVEYILCHVGANINKDYFTDEELQSSYATIVNKPINWEHSNKNIGVNYEAKYVKASELTDEEKVAYAADNKDLSNFVVVHGVIWKYKFPAEAREIKERHDGNNLWFSMETWFQEAQCSDCQATFTRQKFYCEHLASRHTKGSKTNRILIKCTFGGAAAVRNPADKGAKSLSLGSAKSTLQSDTNLLYKYLSNVYGFELFDIFSSVAKIVTVKDSKKSIKRMFTGR